MLMLKLHGSANWQQHEKTDIIHLTTPFDFFPQLGTTFLRTNLSPADRRLDESLVIPTYLKKISDNPILVKLWALAASRLRLADEIIAIGYSLNPADQAASSLISEAILNSQKKPKITVVNCNPANWESFCKGLGVQPDYAKMKFEEWLSPLPQAAA